MISQTSYAVGALFLGFLVFVTIRGELPKYKAAILGGSSPASSTEGK